MLLYENLRKKLIAEFDMDISRGNMVDLGMLNSCRRLKEYFSDSNDVHETSIVFVKDGKINTFKYKLIFRMCYWLIISIIRSKR